MIFDLTYTEIDNSEFKQHDGTKFYGVVKEAIPMNAQGSRDKDVDLRQKSNNPTYINLYTDLIIP